MDPSKFETLMRHTIVSLAMLAAFGCSSTPEKGGDPNNEPAADMSSTPDEGQTTDDMASSTDTGGGAEPTCEGLALKASGTECGTCGFSCDCEEGFPISLAVCSPDGCLVAADCPALCEAGLEFGFDCTDVYTVCGEGECP